MPERISVKDVTKNVMALVLDQIQTIVSNVNMYVMVRTVLTNVQCPNILRTVNVKSVTRTVCPAVLDR